MTGPSARQETRERAGRPGLPRMGPAREARRRRKGRAGPAGGRGRPLPAVGGSAPPFATATAAPHRPSAPLTGGVPRGGLRGPAGRAGQGRGRHGKLPSPWPLGRSCRVRLLPAPRPCVRRHPAASGPGQPGRRRPGTLRAQHVGSRDERREPGQEGLRDNNPRPHFTDVATEAREGPEPAGKGRDLGDSAT